VLDNFQQQLQTQMIPTPSFFLTQSAQHVFPQKNHKIPAMQDNFPQQINAA